MSLITWFTEKILFKSKVFHRAAMNTLAFHLRLCRETSQTPLISLLTQSFQPSLTFPMLRNLNPHKAFKLLLTALTLKEISSSMKKTKEENLKLTPTINTTLKQPRVVKTINWIMIPSMKNRQRKQKLKNLELLKWKWIWYPSTTSKLKESKSMWLLSQRSRLQVI